MTAPRRTFTGALGVKPCDCGQFSVGNPTDMTWSPIPCGATTKRTFAPGHDARLKGYLIRSATAGVTVRRTVDGVHTDKTAFEWADIYGFGYLVRQGAGLALGKAMAKSSAKAAKIQPAPKAERTVAEILEQANSLKDLSREDEQTVRDALGTFIDDPAEAELEAYATTVHVHDVMDRVAEELAAVEDDVIEAVLPTVAKVGRHQYEGELINGEFHYNDRKGNPQVAKKFTLV